MGRMADARKRAQQKKAGGEGGAPMPPTPPAAVPAAAPVPPEPPAEPAPALDATAPQWVSREETLTFPADPMPPEADAPPPDPFPKVC